MATLGDSPANGKHEVERPFVNASVLVALVSGFLYIAAYQYEKGFCGYYGIPNSLIVVDLTAVVAGAATLLARIIHVFDFFRRHEKPPVLQTCCKDSV